MDWQVFVMNNDRNDPSIGRTLDAYRVQSREGQDLTISWSCQWRRDPDMLVWQHQKLRNVEEQALRPIAMRIIKDAATSRMAIDAYSGAGLVALQKEISEKMQDPDGPLVEQGVIVNNFVIEGIELDAEYISEIKKRQVATQRELRAKEEEKAALAEAQKAKAEAQADYEREVVGAERDAKIMVVNAQAENEKVVIAAQAAAEQVKVAADAKRTQMELEGEGKKLQQIAEAEGVLAMGKAEAEAKQLLFSAWSSPGAENYVVVQVAGPEGLSGAFKNIKGYIPSDMKINVLSESFMDSLRSVAGAMQKGSTD
jgi:regulator of protease activity HflC (stomatin/prohibitin superfamily)